MGKRILLIQGHPDAAAPHLCHALARAYAAGAEKAGHTVRTVDVGALDFPLLRSADEWEHGAAPEALRPAQADVAWAGHLVLIFPLWLGDMPAKLKGFLEQVARPGFAFDRASPNPLLSKGLRGRSARIVVTMGMPAGVYQWFYRAHSVKSLERNILGFVGISPVHRTLIGGVGKLSAARARRMCEAMTRLGEAGE